MLLLNTRNISEALAIARHKFTDRMERFKMVEKLFPSGQLGDGSYVGSPKWQLLPSHIGGTYKSFNSDSRVTDLTSFRVEQFPKTVVHSR